MPSSMTLSNVLLPGEAFRREIVSLMGDVSDVRRVLVTKHEVPVGSCSLVSRSHGPFPVYASWKELSKTVLLSSEADLIRLNPDARWMFSGFSCLGFLETHLLDTSCVTNMGHMFDGCRDIAFDPDLSSWDVSHVWNMAGMFRNCSGDSFSPDLSSWDVSSVTYMNHMFVGCNGLNFNPDVSCWDVSRVRDLAGMFSGCDGESFCPDLSSWGVPPELPRALLSPFIEG